MAKSKTAYFYFKYLYNALKMLNALRLTYFEVLGIGWLNAPDRGVLQYKKVDLCSTRTIDCKHQLSDDTGKFYTVRLNVKMVYEYDKK